MAYSVSATGLANLGFRVHKLTIASASWTNFDALRMSACFAKEMSDIPSVSLWCLTMQIGILWHLLDQAKSYYIHDFSQPCTR